jgi:hypothetical protein
MLHRSASVCTLHLASSVFLSEYVRVCAWAGGDRLAPSAIVDDVSQHRLRAVVSGGAARLSTTAVPVSVVGGAFPALFSCFNQTLEFVGSAEAVALSLVLESTQGAVSDAGSVNYALFPRNFGVCGPEWVPLFTGAGALAIGCEVLISVSCGMLHRTRDEPVGVVHGGFVKVRWGGGAPCWCEHGPVHGRRTLCVQVLPCLK